VRLWRIAVRRFAQLDGRGAELYGGRWNSPGRPLVYAASTLSLAMLELLARLPTGEVPRDYVAIAIELPDDATVEEVTPTDLPGWDAADQTASRAFGDAWLAASRSVLLRVPALAVPQERNALLNPRHPDFAHVTALPPTALAWDRRLFVRRDIRLSSL
jgi:RES domain-containing protein